MGLGGCYSFIKYLMVFINFIIFILSFIIVGLAVWMLLDPTFYVSMAVDSSNYSISLYMLLAGGLFLLLVSFLGCCGSCRESQCMLISFFCILLIIVVAQIAAAVWVYCNSDKLEAMIRFNVKSTVQEEYYKDKRLEKTFDVIQEGLACCGAEYPSDWNESKNIIIGASLEEKYFNIPKSCCRTGTAPELCEKATQKLNMGGGIDYNVVYKSGCVTKVVEVVHDNMVIVLIVAIVIIIIEFIGLIFSLILAFGVSNSRHYKR